MFASGDPPECQVIMRRMQSDLNGHSHRGQKLAKLDSVEAPAWFKTQFRECRPCRQRLNPGSL